MKPFPLVLCVSAFSVVLLTSSTCTPKMTVGLPYAKTDGRQYLNTGLHDFGSFYVWDRGAKTLTRLEILDDGLQASPIEASVVKQSLSSGFDISFSGNVPASAVDNSQFIAAAASTVRRDSSITLLNAKTKRFKRGFGVLNSSETYEFRSRIAEQFGHDPKRYRFVFIEGQIEADDATFKITKSSDSSVTVSEPSVGSVKLKVLTSGINEESYKGKNVPVLLEVSLLKLTRSPSTEGSGAGYRFAADTENTNQVLTQLLRGN
ncbi:hypothetical protein HNR46_000401 [Haloferula luteola]|uniref:Uncharacterized protein n=1 Tax=Haloferula luteola TaxID=595692 RepID=A0A840V8A1_9BACT|nr:hypothetical protein [Haloferula luteola]MBB5350180.1 hypothetical protein [Haloferula luteola]